MDQKDATRDLAILVVATISLTVGLHQLGNVDSLRLDWSDPVGWLNTASAEEAVGGLLRSIGLAVSYWVAGSTVLYIAATVRNRDSSTRLLRLITLPGIRRVADRALATALAASIAIGPPSPALAEDLPPPPAVFEVNTDGIPVPHVRLPDTTNPHDDTPPPTPSIVESEAAVLPPIAPRPAATEPAAATEQTATTHHVVSGDNLWRIAASHLQTNDGIDASPAAITEYWSRVVAANRPTLRSGDPNLIFPGEIIALPPLEAAP